MCTELFFPHYLFIIFYFKRFSAYSSMLKDFTNASSQLVRILQPEITWVMRVKSWNRKSSNQMKSDRGRFTDGTVFEIWLLIDEHYLDHVRWLTWWHTSFCQVVMLASCTASAEKSCSSTLEEISPFLGILTRLTSSSALLSPRCLCPSYGIHPLCKVPETKHNTNYLLKGDKMLIIYVAWWCSSKRCHLLARRFQVSV